MEPLSATLKQLDIGDPVTAHNLAMFPLMGGGLADPGYVTLDEALATGRFKVTELSDASVNALFVENKLDQAVFMLDGEELVGAKQDRVLNLSILVPAMTTLTIPVSCVEQGRWSDVSRFFSSGGHVHEARGRALRSRSVSERMLRSAGRDHRGDQHEVWHEMASAAFLLGADSPTMAMRDVFKRHERTVESYVSELRPLDHQRGAVFALNGALAGLELFDSPSTLSELLPKIVRSYALTALARPSNDGHEPPSKNSVMQLLERVSSVPCEMFDAVGEGRDVRLNGSDIQGAALYARDRIIHLFAFVTEVEPQETPVLSFEQRMRRFGFRFRRRI